MAKRGRPRSKMVLQVGEDPTVWRFANLNAALSANPSLLARLIQQGERTKEKSAETIPETTKEGQR